LIGKQRNVDKILEKARKLLVIQQNGAGFRRDIKKKIVKNGNIGLRWSGRTT